MTVRPAPIPNGVVVWRGPSLIDGQPVICLIERGQWKPSERELNALARVLGVTPPAALLAPVTVNDPPVEEPA